MRALAAILILSACPCLRAQPRGLQTIQNIIDCGLALGPSKCLNALTAWRAERAINHPNMKINLKDDLEQFPWNKYSNSTEEELYSDMCDGTEKLLRRQRMSLTMIPGYRLELQSKGNGTLNVDVFRNVETGSSRGMKKAKKALYKFLPLLVLPGLIMSAILPFVLPALKLMTVGVGMLNQMALTGAVFTLLRNNAFNDKYEHKVIYVNEGYKNEKHAHAHHDHSHFDGDSTDDHYDVQYAESKPGYEFAETDGIEEVPMNPKWIKQVYGNNVQFAEHGHQHQLKRVDKSSHKT